MPGPVAPLQWSWPEQLKRSIRDAVVHRKNAKSEEAGRFTESDRETVGEFWVELAL